MAAEQVYGRLYIKNVPVNMDYWRIGDWVAEKTGYRPTWVHRLKPGIDLRSAYLHFYLTMEELQEIAQQLHGLNFGSQAIAL